MKKLEQIVHQFIDSKGPMDILPFGNGLINHTFRVTFSEGNGPQSFLLQKINHQIFREPEVVMENIWAVAEHLSAQPYPLKILKPIPTLSGKLIHLDEGGNHWRVFPFFEKTYTHEKVETTEQAFEAAKAFGIFMKTVGSMDASKLKVTIPQFHDGLARFRFFEKTLVEASLEKREEAKVEIDEILRHKNFFEKIARLKLPARVVHHDTKINNLLFDKESRKSTAVIDLDTLMPGVVLSDFGDLVRTSVCPVEEDEPDLTKVVFREEIYEAIAKGFLSEMEFFLTRKEKENLPLAGSWLTLMQTVRFLTDHLAGDVYYLIKYEGHNLVRTKCQMRLFHQMEKWRKQQVS